MALFRWQNDAFSFDGARLLLQHAKALNGHIFRVVSFDRATRTVAVGDLDPVTSTSRHDGVADDHPESMAQSVEQGDPVRATCRKLLATLTICVGNTVSNGGNPAEGAGWTVCPQNDQLA